MEAVQVKVLPKTFVQPISSFLSPAQVHGLDLDQGKVKKYVGIGGVNGGRLGEDVELAGEEERRRLEEFLQGPFHSFRMTCAPCYTRLGQAKSQHFADVKMEDSGIAGSDSQSVEGEPPEVSA